MIVVNIIYSGEGDNALQFAKEMISSGTVDIIRSKKGNLRYEYFTSFDDPNIVLLIDAWENQEALDEHHQSPVMETIAKLREKYDVHMKVTRYVEDKPNDSDEEFIRK